MTDEETSETLARMADQLKARLADQLERLSDEDDNGWSANERVHRLWSLAEHWPSEDLLRDAVALVAARSEVRWSPKSGLYDGLTRLAYPHLDAQRLAEVIKASASIGFAVVGEPGPQLTVRRFAALKEIGGVSKSTRKAKRLKQKRLSKVVRRMDRRSRNAGAAAE